MGVDRRVGRWVLAEQAGKPGREVFSRINGLVNVLTPG
jgi:hypothetical protein